MGRGSKPGGGQRTRGARPPMAASQIPAPPSRQTSGARPPAFGTVTSPSLPRETARQQTRGGRPPRWEQTIGGKPTNSLNAFRSFTEPTPRKQSTRGGRPPRWEQTIGGRGGREFLKQFFRSGRR